MCIATYLASSCLLLFGTLALAQSVTYDCDRTATFSSYGTYAWTRGTELTDELNHAHVVRAIDAGRDIRPNDKPEDRDNEISESHESMGIAMCHIPSGYQFRVERPRQSHDGAPQCCRSPLTSSPVNHTRASVWHRRSISSQVRSTPRKHISATVSMRSSANRMRRFSSVSSFSMTVPTPACDITLPPWQLHCAAATSAPLQVSVTEADAALLRRYHPRVDRPSLARSASVRRGHLLSHTCQCSAGRRTRRDSVLHVNARHARFHAVEHPDISRRSPPNFY
jgi:hypothetical protein